MTLTERKYRTEFNRLLANKKAETVNQVMEEVQRELNLKSVTTDNGSEFAKLSEVLTCPVIIVIPLHHAIREATKNHNLMIRRFLPKGTKKPTLERVDWIEKWIYH